MSKEYINEPAWYSYMGPYKGIHPAYYENNDYSWVSETESRYPEFKEGLEKYLKSHGEHMIPYFLKTLPTKYGNWKMAPFFFWGKRIDESCDAAPEVEAFLKTIPGLLTATVSWLEPNTEIKAHYGDSNVMIRAHLGLKIPAGLPECGLEVCGEQRGWEEGKWILFCDAQYHRAWNNTDEVRYVLIADIIHPHFLKDQEDICLNVHSLLRLQQIEMRHNFVQKLPGFVRGIIRHILKEGFRFKILTPKRD